MTDFYTNQYGQIPRSSTSSGAITTSRSWAPKGATGGRVGETVTVIATFANTTAAPLTAADTLHVCPLPYGAKVVYIGVGASADMDTDNDFTFDLGVTGATTRFASASTGLQATTAVELDFSDQFGDAAVSTNGAELLLTAAAGELEAAGTITIECRYTLT